MTEICIHEVKIHGEWVSWSTMERPKDWGWNFQTLEAMKPEMRYRIVKQRPHSIHCAGYMGSSKEIDLTKCDCGSMQ